MRENCVGEREGEEVGQWEEEKVGREVVAGERL